MPTMPMPTLQNVDPYARTPAKLSKTGKTFAFVLALHAALLWLAQSVWTSEPVSVIRDVVATQLVEEFRARELPKSEPQPLAPKTPPALQATPVQPPQVLAPVSPVPPALPAITAAPVTASTPTAPVAPATPKLASVVVAASARMDSCAKPRYPPASERLHEEGVVSLKFLISENGQVLSSNVEKSSGYKRLDDAALAALSLCKFKPATVDGKPRQERAALLYRWQLTD